jgi:hypothetical protein
MDIIRTIKGFEKDFLSSNLELYNSDRLEYLKQRDTFVTKKIEELKEDEEE